MFDFDGIHEIWQTITRNKTRSLLTAFGVFWGIFLLVILTSTGNGFENGLMRQVEGVTPNTGFFFTDATSEPYKGYQKGRRWSMQLADLEAVREAFPCIKAISPEASVWSSEDKNVIYGSRGGSFTVKGVMPEYNEIEKSKILRGRFINDTDIAARRKVCLIGKKVYETLFEKGENPLGKMLKVNGIYFQVVGVVRSYTDNVNINGSIDESVILPFDTMRHVYGIGDKINFFAFVADDDTPVPSIEEDIKQLIKQRHDIAPTDKEAIESFNLTEIFKAFKGLFFGIHILIWIVGLGTLMSGIIGVSNIMLVTVKERTREIGVRRALGAKPKNIIGQVLSESLLLTTLAGLVGLCLGVSIMAVVAMVMANNPSDNTMFQDPNLGFGAAVAATVIVIISGLLAGVLPAWRAIQIKAIDAIREE
ncbi:MAG: ABC transporter permease [bacterium]|jgi:putative ABC transport system permease protein|nr:ABC transporter permease [bacterium]